MAEHRTPSWNEGARRHDHDQISKGRARHSHVVPRLHRRPDRRGAIDHLREAVDRIAEGWGPPIDRRAVMRAIVLEKFGGLDSLVYRDLPEPEPKAGHVVIQIKAFG